MSTHIRIEITEDTLKSLVTGYLQNKLGDVSFDPSDVKIEVKSAQNYKAEWEKAAYRAVFDGLIE